MYVGIAQVRGSCISVGVMHNQKFTQPCGKTQLLTLKGNSKMEKNQNLPSKTELQSKIIEKMYSGKVLNNSHRGDLVEAMLLIALENDWNFVGLGWHPWDLEGIVDGKRIRIQVKQLATQQLWGKTKKCQVSFGWSKSKPWYFDEYNPGVEIENEGWFCDIFVIGLHLEENLEVADQLDINQWKFLVIPTCELNFGTGSMILDKALKKWTPVSFSGIKEQVILESKKQLSCLEKIENENKKVEELIEKQNF